MRRLRDRRRWKSAGTFAELGELMVLWLEGQIETWPGHDGGPDPETTALIPTLAACNRAGYLTSQSQPGQSGPGFDGLLWEQRAAVEGFIADARLLTRLCDAADGADLMVIVHSAGGVSTGPREGVTVTLRDGRDYTGFGMRLDGRHLACQWPGVAREPFREIAAAWQVTLIDPEYGRNDRLWPVLDQVGRSTGGRPR